MLQAVRKCAVNAIAISRILSSFVSVLVCLDLCLRQPFFIFFSLETSPSPSLKSCSRRFLETVKYPLMQVQHLLWCCLEDIVAIMADSLAVQGRDGACRNCSRRDQIARSFAIYVELLYFTLFSESYLKLGSPCTNLHCHVYPLHQGAPKRMPINTSGRS